MPPDSLKQVCDLMSDVAITNAAALRQKLTDLARRESVDLDPEDILKTFAFMNWTFAAGVWSDLQNIQLRRDLKDGLKDSLVLKLAQELCVSGGAVQEAVAAVGAKAGPCRHGESSRRGGRAC